MAMFDFWKKKKTEEVPAEEVESVVEETVVEEESSVEEETLTEEEVSTLEEEAPAPEEELLVEEEVPTVGEEIPTVEEEAPVVEAETPAEEETVPAEEETKKKGFFARLKEGLAKTRGNIVSGIDNVFRGFTSIDDEFYEEIEEILIMGDIGVHATEAIISDLKKKVKEQHIKEPADCKKLLMESIMEQMELGEAAYLFEEQPSVIFVIGVNGVGKTTTIGKLASKLRAQDKKVVLAAADTFRAAADSQLEEWARRAGAEMIKGQEGADPASVVFDAAQAAKARHADVLIVDTAGRLHNKKNLMDELAKMNRILDREFPDWHRENLVVLDAATGQNALQQAKIFGEATNITGIVLTKMDGTAKGGIAIAIQSELGIPVKFIGVGEKIEDLQKFNSTDFVNALFDVEIGE